MPFFAPIQDPKGAVWLDAHLPWLAANLNTQPPENGIQKSSLINYPKQPVQCHADTPKDMVWVVLESWQADTLDKQTMPHTFALAQSAWNFRQHVSGGNSTVPGLFSLLYGLHPTYYDAFRGDPKAHPSYFTDTLASLGYESRVFTSGTLETFSMRPLFFSKVKDEHFHHFQGQATETEDAHLLEAWKKSRTESQASPRFDFIFFNSSHYPYSYPASFLKHQPVSENKAAYILNRDMDQILRRYQASTHGQIALAETIQKHPEVFGRLRTSGDSNLGTQPGNAVQNASDLLDWLQSSRVAINEMLNSESEIGRAHV